MKLWRILLFGCVVGCASGPISDEGLSGEDPELAVPTWLEERPPIELSAPPRRRRSSGGFWFEGRNDEEEESSEPAKPPVDVRKEVAIEVTRVEAVRRGYRLYRRACATCHGSRADGNGPSAAGLETPPADLSSGSFLYTSGDDETLNEELFQILTDGIDREMPAWGKLLSERDRWSIVAFLRAL